MPANSYDVGLVGLSIVIAILAAYSALDLAGRVVATQGRGRFGWLVGGAIAMGIGIWAMHFIGMLAFCTPLPVRYDWTIVGLSILPALAASGLALFAVSQFTISRVQLALGSLCMGLGIAAMHYTGIAAMKLSATVTYDLQRVFASVAIAIVVSGIALDLAFQLREQTSPNWALRRLFSGALMGLAIPTMHYTGMAAISFNAIATTEILASNFDTGILAVAIGLGAGLILGLTLLTAFLDRSQAQRLSQTLCELQQTQFQLIQAEKMSSLGQLVAGIAHEINNPISFIAANLSPATAYMQSLTQLIDQYQQHYPHPAAEIQTTIDDIDLNFLLNDFQKLILSMQVGTDRIRELVLSLRNFSRLEEAETKRVDIHQGIESTLLLLSHRLKANGSCPEIVVQKHYGDLPLVDCYAGQLNQVFMNILSNAIDALRDRNDSSLMILITTESVGRDHVQICIKDNGNGIPDGIRSKIFDPFFTTKPVGTGTGLGLSISYQIINKHHGSLTCLSAPHQGTEFRIKIPLTVQAT
ncbi:MAG TPA: MHYT domain-containing protein [Leptolyngbya sp.]|nr:MHYT domain-containing protein [Leptolyngbya sp.]